MSDTLHTTIEPDQPHHITCVVRELLPVFSQPEVVNIIFESWRQLREQHAFRLYGYVVMEEHLHFLAQAERLDSCLHHFMEQTAGRIITYLEEQGLKRFLERLPVSEGGRRQGRAYRFWQETPEVEPITENAMMRTLEYIHINPVKRGYVDRTEHWRYSSARNYAGENGLLEIDCWCGEAVA